MTHMTPQEQHLDLQAQDRMDAEELYSLFTITGEFKPVNIHNKSCLCDNCLNILTDETIEDF